MKNDLFNMFSLEGKTILITGASSGIGKSCAINCSRLGAKLILFGRNINNLEKTKSLLHGKGHILFEIDFNDSGQLDKISSDFPVIDGFINSAGILKKIPVKFLTKTIINEVLNINLISPILLIQKLLKLNKINKNSSLVFISSIDGPITGHIGNSLYGASKAGINGFSKSIAVELAPKQIRVNTISPGAIESPMLKNSEISGEQLEQEKLLYPLKRFGDVNEIANAAIFLLSDASLWTTGSNLVIDGGFTII
jgi:NAD(P)-dependent dehydrogenase (short-subunit alcohol dehydrogenase family)